MAKTKEEKLAIKREINRKWAAANPEKVLEASRKWRAANREKHNAEGRAYRKAHPEMGAASLKAWVKKNPHKMAEYGAAWRERNPEKVKAQLAAYRASPNGLMVRRILEAKRRARKRSAPGTFTKADVVACLAMTDGRCFYCLAPITDDLHVDHMTPLSRGGSNWPDNIVCACRTCNEQKHARTAAEFILGIPRERSKQPYRLSDELGRRDCRRSDEPGHL